MAKPRSEPQVHGAYDSAPAATSALHLRTSLELEASRGRSIKVAFDVVVASLCLILLSPLMALIALAILADTGGPIIFRQERIGKNGRAFTMFKFRTMIPDRRKANTGVPPGLTERRRVHKSWHDPRVTRVGRLLRRFCLDELPQFWNVLRGDMSVVGPRPELPQIVARYEPWQHARHLVAPGITGWWQVNRTNGVLMHEATLLDLYYVQNWSVWLDLRILVRTAAIVLRGVGAF
jgi:lipopolysaccharide/colanic/teichoic acid biosynthesis glycosyltransferase